MRKRKLILSVLFVIAAVLTLFRNSAAAKQFLSQQNTILLPMVMSGPAPVAISEWDMMGMGRNYWNGVGDVLAPNDVVTNVIVEGREYSIDGTLLYRTTATTVFTTTLPGQRNPFFFGFPFVDPSIPCCEYTFDIISWSSPTAANIFPLTAISTTIHYSTWPDPASAYVVATVRNDYSFQLTNVKGVIWSVHQANTASGQLISDLLLPGEAATFTQLIDQIGPPEESSIRISVQGKGLP